MQHNKRERLTGIENEWSIVYNDPDDDTKLVPLSIEETCRVINRCIPQYLSLSQETGGMASNGMRIYKDPTGFVETATGEELSLDGIVASDIATERIIADMVSYAIDKEAIPPSSRVNKRVIGDYDPIRKVKDPTWGYHVNFAADAEKISATQDRLLPLALHLATMNIYAGAGILRGSGSDTSYAIAQKVLNLTSVFSRESYGTARPLVSLRSEHHAKSSENVRIHVTTMDAHISPWATRMSIGTTSIIVRLMESGYRANELANTINTPIHKIAQGVATDPELVNKYTLLDGRIMSALDIQNYLYERACELELSPDEAAIMPEWRRALDILADDPNDLVEADWVMRRRLIMNKLKRVGGDLGSKAARQLNNEYDLVYRQPVLNEKGEPRASVVDVLRASSAFARHMPSSSLIESRLTTPSPETRAHIRARLITDHIAKKAFGACWTSVNYTDDNDVTHRFDLMNPYDNVNEHENIPTPEK